MSDNFYVEPFTKEGIKQGDFTRPIYLNVREIIPPMPTGERYALSICKTSSKLGWEKWFLDLNSLNLYIKKLQRLDLQ